MKLGSICHVHPELAGLRASDGACAKCKQIKSTEWRSKKRALAQASKIQQSEFEIRATKRAKYLRYVLAKENRIPPWADTEKIKEVYRLAAEVGMTVDHVIPLRGKLVSGLHVHNNLQLLAGGENSKKGNKYVP